MNKKQNTQEIQLIGTPLNSSEYTKCYDCNTLKPITEVRWIRMDKGNHVDCLIPICEDCDNDTQGVHIP